MLKDLLLKNRSYRRFDNNYSIDRDTLVELIDMARIAPSAANLQPLKYKLICNDEENSLVFRNLGWAGYLKDWDGPIESERPSAYIIVLGDTDIRESFGCDHGIAAQTILLSATEKSLGGCMFDSVKRDRLRADLNLDDRYKILLVIALGKPIEKICLEEIVNKDIKYWRDEKQIHHVPKRRLNEIIVD